MEEVSTLYTNCFRPLPRAKLATAYGLSSGRQNQVVAVARRLVTYILGPLHGALLAAEKTIVSHKATFPSNTITGFSNNAARMVNEFAKFNGEPPDKPDSDSFSFQPYHSQNPLLLLHNGQ